MVLSRITWFCAFLTLLACGSALASVDRAGRAAVLVYGKSLDSSGVGQGFLLGDGTIAVTARHVLYGHPGQGEHRTDAMVEVISPYLGDAREAQVVGEDRVLNLAILRVPWKGHPALALASSEMTMSAGELSAVAYADAARAVAEGRAIDLQGRIEVQTRKLPVDPMWGGSALLKPDGAVAGAWNGSAIVAAARIRRMIDAAGLQQSLNPNSNSLTAYRSAPEATRMYLWSWALSAAGKHEMSYFAADTFVLLRPTSALGHKNVAVAASQWGRLDRAEKAYQRALECDPRSVAIRVLYGQFLAEHNEPTRALAVLRAVWEPAQMDTIAVIPMCNLLAKQGYYSECITLLQRAVERRPNDGLLWIYLAQNLRSTSNRAKAADAFARAAKLMPEKHGLHTAVAEEFEAAGLSAEAEQQYRRLAHQSTEIPAGHFLLAQFLAKDPRRHAEAMEECEAALAMPTHPDAPPRQVVEKLMAELRRRDIERHGIRFPTSQALRL